MALAYSLPRHRPELQAVIWDYDGTLIASHRSDGAAVDMIVARIPGTAQGAEIFWQLEGEPLTRRVARAWPGLESEVMKFFEHEEPPVLFPGVVAALNHFRDHDVPMGVVSSRLSSSLREGLTATGLRSYFGVVIGLDDVANPKPDPEGLVKAMQKLNAEPAATIFIGDSLLDMEAAHRAGTQRLHALWRDNELKREAEIENRFVPALRDPRQCIGMFTWPPSA